MLSRGCSLDGLADGKVSTATSGQTSSSGTSSSTGGTGPAMFEWAIDIRASAAPNGAIRLAQFGSTTAIAVSGAAAFDVAGTSCGSMGAQNLCLALVDQSGKVTPFAEGVSGDAPKAVAAIEANPITVALAGTFQKSGTITFGTGSSAVSFSNTTSFKQAFVATFDATTHILKQLRACDPTLRCTGECGRHPRDGDCAERRHLHHR